MAATLLPAGGITLFGAPDSDIGIKDAKSTPVQVMQVDMTQDIVDELLESVRGGKSPVISFGRTPQLKYADKTHILHTSSESYRYELYQSSGSGSNGLDFAGLINHSLTVQKADDVTSGVDTALEQLKSSMAAISELKEANKTIVGTATSSRTPGHRRFPSTGFKPSHLASSMTGSPHLSVPSSPVSKRAPTSQPGSTHDMVLSALRVPLIHLLALQPTKDARLAETCRTSLANVRDLLPKIAKRTSQDPDTWQLTDKSWREINPWKFAYKTSDREQAVDSAIKAFDRLRLPKDDKLWQILLPQEERGQGKCLSRLTVKAHDPKAAPKPATPLHKMSKLTEKKPVAKKADNGEKEKRPREVKEAEPKPRKTVKEKVVREKPAVKVNDASARLSTPATATATTTANTPTTKAPTSHRNTPTTEASKVRTKKAPAPSEGSTPRVKPKMSNRDLNKERIPRPTKPPVNTKPKNPSPLSASPPVNASDFEDSHPVHKALSANPSPAKASGNSDRVLKRKANDTDSDIHNHSLAVKKPNLERSTPNGRLNGSTPSSGNSLKRKSDESSTSSTPTTAPKVRKVTKVASIDTHLASRYHHSSQASPGDSSSSNTSPSMPSLSFRQTVELSQKFQKYYKKYEELYWQLTEADVAPTEAQRNDLLKMHKKLEEMKREIKAGAGRHH